MISNNRTNSKVSTDVETFFIQKTTQLTHTPQAVYILCFITTQEVIPIDNQNITGNMVASGEPTFNHDKLSLAMAYVLMQPPITKVYKAEDALKVGTLFPDLDKPFLGYR